MEIAKKKWSICFAGEAGLGVDKTAGFFGNILASYGYNVFIYRDYGSLIRGGHNFSIVTFSNEEISCPDMRLNILLAYDKNSIDFHRNEIIEGGEIFTSDDFGIDEGLNLDQKKTVKARGLPGNFGNNIGCGALVKYFGIPFEYFETAAEKHFGEKAEAVKELGRVGYDMISEKFVLEKNGEERIMMDGSEAGARAIADIGNIPAFYYPMTPATGLFERLQNIKPDEVIQVDDEITAINAAIGAGYSRGIALTGSSGGGIALMSEGISFAGMAETPVVIYFAQRQGPSTGVPTYSEQGDLKFALNSGPGEFPKIVISPADAIEMYQATEEAVYLAKKYKCPVIILSDKHIAESYFSVKEDELKLRNLSDELPLPVLPGGEQIVRASSYEHDENGFTTEDKDVIRVMNDKRLLKMKRIQEEVNNDFEPLKIYGEGENLIIFTGSVKGAVVDNLFEIPGWRAIGIKYLEPFPAEQLKKEIEKSERVTTVEMNATGLLSQIITEKTGFFTEKILRYDGRPIIRHINAEHKE